MEDVRDLGTFVPSGWQREVIEAELRPLLPPCCQRERIIAKGGDPNAPVPHPDNLQWHQDGGGAAGTTKHMVIWASETPTEILTRHGLYVVEPFHVTWFDNTKVLHRQPAGTNEATRWFVAVRCSGALT